MDSKEGRHFVKRQERLEASSRPLTNSLTVCFFGLINRTAELIGPDCPKATLSHR